jgi:triphosphatase
MTRLELATENGRHLAKAGRGRVTKAPKADVHLDMSVADGFTAIVLSCLEHFRSNEWAFVDERDPEALHQLRVATRRLRTALDLFRPILRRSGRYRKLRKEWRRVSRSLGEVRNLDVALTLLDSRCADQLLKQTRDDAYGRIGDMLNASPFRDMRLGMARWLASGGWRRSTSAGTPLESFCLWRFDKAWTRLRAWDSLFSAMPDDRRHRFRVRLKQLRYSLDFLRPLHRGWKEERKAFRSSIEALQDDLGILNDLSMAEHMAALNGCSIAKGSDSRSPAAILESAEQHRQELLEAGPYWRN